MSAEVLDRPKAKKGTQNARTPESAAAPVTPPPPKCPEVSATAEPEPAQPPAPGETMTVHGVTNAVRYEAWECASICQSIVAHLVAAGYQDKFAVESNTLRHSVSFAHGLLSHFQSDYVWEGHAGVYLDQFVSLLDLFYRTGFEVGDHGYSELAFNPECVSDLLFGMEKLAKLLVDSLKSEAL